MRLVTRLADRALSLVAPRATASACIPPDPWVQHCYCKSFVEWNKNCSYNCAGTAVCGACYSTSVSC
jgi:hypothetical protein